MRLRACIPCSWLLRLSLLFIIVPSLPLTDSPTHTHTHTQFKDGLPVKGTMRYADHTSYEGLVHGAAGQRQGYVGRHIKDTGDFPASRLHSSPNLSCTYPSRLLVPILTCPPHLVFSPSALLLLSYRLLPGMASTKRYLRSTLVCGRKMLGTARGWRK